MNHHTPSIYLVEHYLPGTTAELFRETAERVRAAAETMARNGTPIRYVRSIMVPGDEAAICVFDAPSTVAIELLSARAGVRFDRIVGALEI